MLVPMALSIALLTAVSSIQLAAFTQLHPGLPASVKQILVAHSIDGLRFTVVPGPKISSGLTTPTTISDPNGHAVFVATSGESLVQRADNTHGFNPIKPDPCEAERTVHGRQVRCTDPHLLRLPDGQFRLFYTAHSERDSPSQILSAISTDGRTWHREKGHRLSAPKIGDPDVVLLPDGTWRMYYTSVHQADPEGRGMSPAILSAVSTDGLDFKPEAGIRAMGCSASGTLAIKDGGYRMYCHTRPIFEAFDPLVDPRSHIVSLHAEDGLHFVQESGDRIAPIPVTSTRYIGAEAPTVLIESDGSITMHFATIAEPRFPLNWLLLKQTAKTMKVNHSRPQRRK